MAKNNDNLLTMIDENGNEVPDANIPTVSFSTAGDCRVY